MFEHKSHRVIGFFPDVASARSALAELHNVGFSDDQARMVENKPLRMDGDVSLADEHPERISHRRGFLARLFGFNEGDYDEDRMRSIGAGAYDTNVDRTFTGAYERGRQVVIVEAGDREAIAQEILRRNGAEVDEHAKAWFDERLENMQRLLLREEQLRTAKETIETGEVRVRKEVVTETKTIEVPVEREEAVIERRPVSEAGSFASTEKIDASSLREGEEIRIPLTEEEVHVEKRTVPVEEVRVGKKKVQEARRVSEDVKHEEARVEKTGSARVRNEAVSRDKEPERPGL